MVQLTDDLIAMLDQRAAQEGVSRSQVIREAIVAFFESDRSAAIDRQLVDGYTRMPQGGAYDADEWGDMATLMTALTADQARSLAAEEREAELPPW
jgi:metal-responsive CopG/Arc/MetJ family transcriptional regulator